MGILKGRCDELFSELKDKVRQIDELEERIKISDPFDPEYESLYEREFMLAVTIVGIFEDLHTNLSRLEKAEPEYKFFTHSVRKEADKLVNFGYIELGGK